MTNTDKKKPLLTFPCDFTIKVFGYDTPEFTSAVFGIIHKHAPNLSDRMIQARPSANGKYVALNIDIRVDSQEQLDRIYKDLSASPQILMAL